MDYLESPLQILYHKWNLLEFGMTGYRTGCWAKPAIFWVAISHLDLSSQTAPNCVQIRTNDGTRSPTDTGNLRKNMLSDALTVSRLFFAFPGSNEYKRILQSIDPYFAISKPPKWRKIRVDRKIRGCKIRVDALYWWNDRFFFSGPFVNFTSKY